MVSMAPDPRAFVLPVFPPCPPPPGCPMHCLSSVSGPTRPSPLVGLSQLGPAAQPVGADDALMIANTIRVLRHLVGEE